MKQQLFRAFHTAFSRSKKSNRNQYIIPHRGNIFISAYSYSIKDNDLFYLVKKDGTIIKYEKRMVFYLGKLDKLREKDYNIQLNGN